MNIKYLFDQEITEENKLALKTLTSSISENCNIGIYFTTKTEDLTLDNNYQHEILSNCKSIFYISTNEILEIIELSSIMSFLISQENDDACNFEYYIFATRENSDVVKLVILKYVYYKFNITKFNQGYEINNGPYTNRIPYTKDTYNTKEKLLKLSVSYFMDIVNNNLKTFNVQIKLGIYNEKVTHVDYKNGEHKADLKQMRIFESDKEHHNLIDLYNCYRDKLTKSNVKQVQMHLNTFNSSTSTIMDQMFDKTVTVYIDGAVMNLKFSGEDNFSKIFSWIKKRFGEGEISFDIDLKNNKETIKYSVR